jgi:hypothetical protein
MLIRAFMESPLPEKTVQVTMRAMTGRWVVLVVLACACGGGDDFAPQELVADPAVQTGCVPEGFTGAKVVACVEELPEGRLVSGRVGDLLIQNGTMTVVVRGFGEGYYLMGTAPGGIVDAARAGGEDLVKEILPVFNLNGGGFEEFVITEAGDDGPAEIVVRGPVAPVPFVNAAIATAPVAAIAEQHYILEPNSDALLIRTYLYPLEGGAGGVEVGDAFFMGGKLETFAPGRGFLEGSANVEVLGSRGTTTSYGFTHAGDTILQWIDVANVKIGRGPTRTLGNSEPIDRWLVVGDGSVANTTGRAWALRGQETGSITGNTAPGVDVVVVDGDDAPVTVGRADGDGNYVIDVPPGSYSAYAESPARAPGAVSPVTVTAGGGVEVDLSAGASGTLSVSVEDGGGDPLPARIRLTSGADDRVQYSGADGTFTAGLPPGNWTVVVSRGMEYEAYTADVVVTADQTTEVAAVIDRVVDTAGWVALDTHLHSEMSTDSTITLEDRLLAVAAEGIEVPISTDHDFVTDYAPVVADLGLTDWITPQVGVETSSLVWGHVNTWPHQPDYDRGAGHAFAWYGASPGEVFALMRARPDDPVIQINHPYSSSSGLLNIIDFDDGTLLANADPTELGLPDGTDLSDWNFDAIEVANDLEDEVFDPAFASWLALVGGGHPAVATGSSDSHGKSAFVGKARTYVYVGAGNDDPTQVVAADVNAALKAGKVIVSQGVFVTAAIVDPGTGLPAEPGSLVDLSAETDIQIAIRVQAPSWLPTARIDVYAGPEVATTIDLDDAATDVVRYDDTITIPLSGSADGFLLVRVEPVGRGDPVLGGITASFTNPIRYDRDGDAAWMP